jgi:hypothetical protein
MTREKRAKVAIFSRPVIYKDMKLFLGLVSYFRDHVQFHSHISLTNDRRLS